ncbi:MAG: alanine racemase [Gammaproteobacteria bacterium]|nr:alanine racemase [Gammaproteobacteria bacterium]
MKGVNTADELQLAAMHSLSLVFNSVIQVELAVTTSLTQPLQFCWLMVETGMHRLGIQPDRIELALQSLIKTDNIVEPVGLMSHFANADIEDDIRNRQQLEVIKQIAQRHNVPLSMANSAAIISFPDSHGDWVRPGIMLYGSSPLSGVMARSLFLKPVMRLSSMLISIQNLQAG